MQGWFTIRNLLTLQPTLKKKLKRKIMIIPLNAEKNLIPLHEKTQTLKNLGTEV